MGFDWILGHNNNYMKESQTERKIKELSFSLRRGENENISRETAQTLFLSVTNDDTLNSVRKEMLLNELRKAVRPLSDLDYEGESAAFEINSLLSSLCLAASFYLLEKEKHVRLYESENDIFVKLNKRRFENCFFAFVSQFFRNCDEITVEVKRNGKSCSVLLSAENADGISLNNHPHTVFTVYGHNFSGASLNMKVSEQIPIKDESEDFSLLLSDSLSPLQIWLCDI